MFEVSFPELVILAVVALLVLGPERLPRAARFIGLWVRKARAQWFAVKSEFERELAAEDLKRSLKEAREAVEKADAALREQAVEAGGALRETAREVESATRLTVLDGRDTPSAPGHADSEPNTPARLHEAAEAGVPPAPVDEASPPGTPSDDNHARAPVTPADGRR